LKKILRKRFFKGYFYFKRGRRKHWEQNCSSCGCVSWCPNP